MIRHRVSGSVSTVMVVVAAIMVLFWIFMPHGCGCSGGLSGRQAKRMAAVTQVENFSSALDAFRADCGRYPKSSDGLDALISNPGIPNWKGPYLRGEIPIDPWGINAYQYRARGQGFELRSFGPDGISGTDDDITNLNSGESWV